MKLHRTACLLLLLVYGVLTASYGAIIPFFEGPDEDAHVAYIAHLQQTHRLPTLDAENAGVSHELVQQPPLYYAMAALADWGQGMAAARQLDHRNPYTAKGLSKRYTITLPNSEPGLALPLYIARVVTFLGGLLTVWFTWLLTRALLPTEPWAAIAVASVVGFNPQFLFSSATITNDTWASALFVGAVYLVQRACRMDKAGWWLLAGLSIGAAALTKYSDLLVVIPTGVLFLWQLFLERKAIRWRLWLRALLLLGIGFLASAGFWYVRNLLNQGSPVPMRQILALLPGLARTDPLTFTNPALWAESFWLLRSYWGVFGAGIVATASYHWVVQNLLLAGFLGLGLLLLRVLVSRLISRPAASASAFYTWLTEARQYHWWLTVALATIWFVPLLISLLNWIRIINFGNQGRLLFPGAPALALLLVIGWQAWLPQRWRPWLYRLIPFCFAGLAISQVGTLYENYRLPPSLDASLQTQRPLDAHFAGGMSVLGIDLPQGAAIRPGRPMPVTIYFSTSQPIENFYTLFLHLADGQNRLLYQFDGVPAQGRHPTAQWIPGAVFADTYWIQPAEAMVDGLATLSLGFYPVDDISQRQPLLDATGAQLGDRLLLATVRLHANPAVASAPATPPLAQWEHGITLSHAEVESNADGEPQRLQITWQATQVLQTDYTIFVQLLDRQGKLLAQIDQRPQQGNYPTSTWQAGDRIEDSYQFSSPGTGWQQMIVGFYDAQGKRLLLQTPNAGSDFFVVASNEK